MSPVPPGYTVQSTKAPTEANAPLRIARCHGALKCSGTPPTRTRRGSGPLRFLVVLVLVLVLLTTPPDSLLLTSDLSSAEIASTGRSAMTRQH